MRSQPSLIIDARSLEYAVERLCDASPIMREQFEAYGSPPAWRREPGFSSLVYTILEQQVSLASARAVYERLLVLAGDLTPGNFSTLTDEQLRSIGFSRQKIAYCRIVADLIGTGVLDLEALEERSDEDIRAILTEIKGIGPWTADIYLLHSLGRPDVWPVGDLALRVAVQETLELDRRPTQEETEILGDQFRPLRSVAARILWNGYLHRRGIAEVT